MRPISALLVAASLCLSGAAQAQDIASVHTDLDLDRHCSVFSQAGADDGDWANLVCAGYRGYPVVVYYSDLRHSLFYGFPPDGDPAPAWESFGGFNSVGPKIEWRIEKDGDVERPFATIHRWFVADPAGDDSTVEVLVVEKVGQIADRDGCAVGYVVATQNPDANEKARRIADDEARGFLCGEDRPTIEAGAVPLPDFVRWQQ